MGPLPHFRGVVKVEVYPSNFSWQRTGRGGVEMRYSRYFTDVYASNFSWSRCRRGVVEVRYSIYFVGPKPHFEGVVEVEVYPSNFN